MKVLVLGGYGNFGARIARALAGDAAVELWIGGRDGDRARTFATALGGDARGIRVDADQQDLAAWLRAQGVELLIHTAGPFQQQDYRVAEAAAAAQAHYIDLADGRRFVCDFASHLHGRFQAAQRVGVCGASTVPALSSAVIDHLCRHWAHIDTIDICIAPAQQAPRGRATLAGVLSYCGEPVTVWDSGGWVARTGWADPEPVSFKRMKPRLGSLCDIPDLELLPARYQVRQRVIFRAALELGLAQQALAALASLRRGRVIGPAARWAGVLMRFGGLLDFLGTPTGGMVVRVAGSNADGQATRRAWHITADSNHGPEIPCMAAILLARRLARGSGPAAGASACVGHLTLADFTGEFQRWGMAIDTVEEEADRAA